MTNQSNIKRQQRHLFRMELFSFAGLFIVLGTIVFLLYQHSVYTDIDQTLTQQKNILVTGPEKMPAPGQRGPTTAPFRTDLLVFDTQGKITNQANLGNRYYSYFKNLKLDVSQLNQRKTTVVGTGTFRTLLIKIPLDTGDPIYAGHYVLILQNINGQINALQAFARALIVTIVIFWLVVIILADWLSKRAMRPIMQSWQRQQDFVADAAHELRAPLAVIQSQQEELLTHPEAAIVDQSESIATSLNEITRLQQLTNDLLTIAKTDSNAVEVLPEPVAVASFFDEVLQPYAEITASQHKSLTWSAPADFVANFDAEHIHQLLIILLDNALKYTQAGDSLWVTATPQGHKWWTLTVGNSGAPIADADKAKIFERFYRVDASRNRDTGGHGLGLAIAQWIVSAHQGNIAVKDVEPNGVSFEVKLPQ
nr:HAMP domain-containing sensor histidine kinase [Lacticaseibacillus brantae]